MAMSARKKRVSSDLASLVKTKYRMAEEAHSEHLERAMDCLRQMKGELFPAMEDEEDAADIVMNITLPIVNSLHAMISDVIDPIAERPFVLEPSAIATLPEEVRQELESALEDNFPQLMELTGGDPNAVRQVVSTMVRTATEIFQEEAQEAADRLGRVVTDKLREGQFQEALEDFLQDLLVYPIAILKGPVSELTKIRTWAGMRLTYTEDVVRKTKRISMFNLYPAPGAMDTNSCAYVCERERLTSSDLLDLASVDGYDLDGIDDLLANHDSYILDYVVGGSNDAEPDAEATDNADLNNHGMYDAIGFYGRIHGEKLEEFGVEVSDPRRFYEAEVWVIADYVIKAVLNPDPLGRRPFYTAAFTREPGQLYGTSAVEMIRDAQQQCTAAGRALVRNMGFSSGPIGEVWTKNVLGEDDPTEIYPLMIRGVNKPGEANQPTYRFHTVPSLAQELMAVYDRYYLVAFDLLGVQRLAFGSTQGQSTIGRTSGGVAMMLNQAAKPVKKVMGRVEKRVIEPLIQRYVDYELMYSDDPTIKGDINVRARGVSGLVDRERQEGRLEWALQSLAPFASMVPPQYIMRLIVAMLDQAGVPTKGLPDFDLQDAVTQDLSGAGTGETVPSPGGAQPQQFLDGRSQGAIDTIQTMNNPAGVGGDG